MIGTSSRDAKHGKLNLLSWFHGTLLRIYCCVKPTDFVANLRKHGSILYWGWKWQYTHHMHAYAAYIYIIDIYIHMLSHVSIHKEYIIIHNNTQYIYNICHTLSYIYQHIIIYLCAVLVVVCHSTCAVDGWRHKKWKRGRVPNNRRMPCLGSWTGYCGSEMGAANGETIGKP